MKKRIIKVLGILLLFSIITINISCVNAAIYKHTISHVINEFCNSLKTNNKTNLYNYIDSNNTELVNNFNNYAGIIKSIDYNITDISEDNNVIHVNGNIAAKGDNWNIEGFTVRFDLKMVDGDYIITDTDLFYVISPEHTAKFVSSILVLVFGIIGGIFLMIAITVIVVVIAVRKSKKSKPKTENVENVENIIDSENTENNEE